MNKIVIFVFLILATANSFCQNTQVTSEYLFNPFMINPAIAGHSGAFNVNSFYRDQWVNLKGAPVMLNLVMDAPVINEKIGLGFLINSDKIGVTRETNFISSYAYRIGLSKGSLAFGLSAGIQLLNSQWSDLVTVDPGDQIYLTNSQTYMIPKFGFGIYYSTDKLFAGISIPELISSTFDMGSNKYIMNFKPSQCMYLFNSGYVYSINNKVKLMPSILINYSPASATQYDLNLQCRLLEKFTIGTSYCNQRALVGLLQFQVTNQFRLGYSYDFQIGKIGSLSKGSHEIMVRYEFRYKVNATSPINL